VQLGARNMVAMHWGTFKLTDEPLGEPIVRIDKWWDTEGPGASARDRLWRLDVGETRGLGGSILCPMKGMGKLLVFVGLSALFVACGEPKQAWERPRTAEPEATEENNDEAPATAPTEASAPPKEASHEDVCRQMWTHIQTDAEVRAKKGGKKPPSDKARSDFLQKCYASGKDDPAYPCRKKCIMESADLEAVEKCMPACK